MDTNSKPAMFVHTSSNTVLKFTSAAKDCTIFILIPLTYLIISLTLTIYLVPSKRTFFFIDPKLKEQMLKEFYNVLLYSLPETDFKNIVKGNQLWKVSITVSDIDRAYDIYRPQVFILKEKYVLKDPGHIENIPRIPLPLPIEKDYNNISLIMDCVFINF